MPGSLPVASQSRPMPATAARALAGNFGLGLVVVRRDTSPMEMDHPCPAAGSSGHSTARWTRGLFAVILLTTALRLDAADLGLPMAPPGAATGFSTPRLDRVRALLQREVDDGAFAGAVWLVARDGKIVHQGAAGWSDAATKAPMTEEKIFAIASMTKPVTVVTVLTLIEEGRLALEDPVSRYLPELADMKVAVGGTASAPQLVAAKRPITLRHLLTHTSGFCYGFFDEEPWRTIYANAKLDDSRSLAEYVTKAAKLPLKHQPGEAWAYGISMDILGALVEKVTGQPLETVMRERIFAPLGMKDTGFTRPPRARLALMHSRNAEGRLVEVPRPAGLDNLEDTFASPGGGLYSTRRDYARFAQMLLNDGELDGVRVLGRKTAEAMRSNQVDYLNPRPKDRWIPPGFGFGVRVRRDAPDEAESLGSPGQFGWEGITSTYVSIDPRERMFVLLLTQHAPYDDGLIFERFANTVYQALDR